MSNIVDIKSIRDYDEVSNLVDLVKVEEEENRVKLLGIVGSILPSKLSKANREKLAEEIVDSIDSTMDVGFKEQYKSNLITYSSVLANSGRVRTDDYLNAVQFVTYRNSGLSVRDAYCLIKAEEIQRDKLNNGLTEEQLVNRANAFAQNKIVKDIQASNQVPLHIIYGDAVIDGINRMHQIILNGKDREAIGAFDVLARTVMPKEQAEITLDTSAFDKKIEEYNKAKQEFASSVVANVASGDLSIKDLLSKTNNRNNVIDITDAEIIDAN